MVTSLDVVYDVTAVVEVLVSTGETGELLEYALIVAVLTLVTVDVVMYVLVSVDDSEV